MLGEQLVLTAFCLLLGSDVAHTTEQCQQFCSSITIEPIYAVLKKNCLDFRNSCFFKASIYCDQRNYEECGNGTCDNRGKPFICPMYSQNNGFTGCEDYDNHNYNTKQQVYAMMGSECVDFENYCFLNRSVVYDGHDYDECGNGTCTELGKTFPCPKITFAEVSEQCKQCCEKSKQRVNAIQNGECINIRNYCELEQKILCDGDVYSECHLGTCLQSGSSIPCPQPVFDDIPPECIDGCTKDTEYIYAVRHGACRNLRNRCHLQGLVDCDSIVFDTCGYGTCHNPGNTFYCPKPNFLEISPRCKETCCKDCTIEPVYVTKNKECWNVRNYNELDVSVDCDGKYFHQCGNGTCRRRGGTFPCPQPIFYSVCTACKKGCPKTTLPVHSKQNGIGNNFRNYCELEGSVGCEGNCYDECGYGPYLDPGNAFPCPQPNYTVVSPACTKDCPDTCRTVYTIQDKECRTYRNYCQLKASAICEGAFYGKCGNGTCLKQGSTFPCPKLELYNVSATCLQNTNDKPQLVYAANGKECWNMLNYEYLKASVYCVGNCYNECGYGTCRNPGNTFPCPQQNYTVVSAVCIQDCSDTCQTVYAIQNKECRTYRNYCQLTGSEICEGEFHDLCGYGTCLNRGATFPCRQLELCNVSEACLQNTTSKPQPVYAVNDTGCWNMLNYEYLNASATCDGNIYNKCGNGTCMKPSGSTFDCPQCELLATPCQQFCTNNTLDPVYGRQGANCIDSRNFCFLNITVFCNNKTYDSCGSGSCSQPNKTIPCPMKMKVCKKKS